MANQLIVPGSASTKGNADFRNSATSFSLPGLASRGTYKATLGIVYSYIAVDANVLTRPQKGVSRSMTRCQSQFRLIASLETLFLDVAAKLHHPNPREHRRPAAPPQRG
jgi:hypothetical protein